MPAREPGRRPEDELAVESAPEAAPAPETLFTSDGELPAVAKTKEQAGPSPSERAFENVPVFGDTSALDTGMHQPEHYKEACDRAHRPDKWNPEYAYGHTSAKQFSQPGERAPMAWSLGRGQSAAQAIKDFVAGPTIADFRAIQVALELDELREDMTDNRFDQLFGSRDGADDAMIPSEQRLHISSAMYTTPFVARMRAYAEKREASADDDDPLPPPSRELRNDKPKQGTAPEETGVVLDDLAKESTGE